MYENVEAVIELKSGQADSASYHDKSTVWGFLSLLFLIQISCLFLAGLNTSNNTALDIANVPFDLLFHNMELELLIEWPPLMSSLC